MPNRENMRYCPMCDQSFDTEFTPSHYGVTHRQDASCLNPDCRSLERHRLLWLYLQDNILTANTGFTVLEIGPTRSLKHAFGKFPNVNYVGVDLFSKRADIKADVYRLPFADDSFDLLICYQVLEHLAEPISAVQELSRVTKHDGKALFQVPLDVNLATTTEVPTSSPQEREILFGQSDHLRIFGTDFPDFLSKGGFNSRCISYVDHFTEEDRIRMGLKSSYPIGPKEATYTTSESFYLATKTRTLQKTNHQQTANHDLSQTQNYYDVTQFRK